MLVAVLAAVSMSVSACCVRKLFGGCASGCVSKQFGGCISECGIVSDGDCGILQVPSGVQLLLC